jgi:hypothetical protein
MAAQIKNADILDIYTHTSRKRRKSAVEKLMAFSELS